MLPEWRIAGCLGKFCLVLSCSVALKRWKDSVVRDLWSRDLLASWYDVARDCRSAWRNTYFSVTCNQHRVQPIECSDCNRSFARPSDRARHKCSAERARPVSDQKRAQLCHRCDCWSRSAGGMAVLRCSNLPSFACCRSRTPSGALQLMRSLF